MPVKNFTHKFKMFALSATLLLSGCGVSVQPTKTEQSQQVTNSETQNLIQLAQLDSGFQLGEKTLKDAGYSLNFDQAVFSQKDDAKFLTVFSSDKQKFITLSFEKSVVKNVSLVQITDTSRKHFAQTFTDLRSEYVTTAINNLDTGKTIDLIMGKAQGNFNLTALSRPIVEFSSLANCNLPASLSYGLTSAQQNLAAAVAAAASAASWLISAQFGLAACVTGVACPAAAANYAAAIAGVAAAAFWVSSAQNGIKAAQSAISEWRTANHC
jgi:hypothetical protein